MDKRVDVKKNICSELFINHPTVAEINVEAFSANLKEIRKWVGPQKKIFPIIKADAYGHGSLVLSKKIVSDGYNTLGVGNLSEAIKLRKSGINCDILVLGGCYNGQEELFIKNRLQPVVYTLGSILNLAKCGKKLGQKVYLHIKIDTGMGRLGFLPNEIEKAMRTTTDMPELVIASLLTHFSSAFLEERKITERQIVIFNEIVKDLRGKGYSIPFVHVANSAGITNFRDSCFDAVRPGILLYGAKPSTHFPENFRLKPVMSFKTRVIQLKRVGRGKPISYGETFVTCRESILATIPVGYADGYPRNVSNKANVLVRGVRVRQVGIVCMDMCVIDVTDVLDVKIGDEVVLFGRQGNEMVAVEEVAEWAGSIPYEILCQVGNRARREYVG